MGRSTQGVRLINVDEGTVLSGLQRISESMDEDDTLADEQESSSEESSNSAPLSSAGNEPTADSNENPAE
jgi:DNA gyrase subunit A